MNKESEANGSPAAATLRWRKRQVLAVTSGVMSFTTALVGGALEVTWLAQVGVAGFVVCLIAIITMGVFAARSARD